MTTTGVGEHSWLRSAGPGGAAAPSRRDRWLAAGVAGLCLGAAFWTVRGAASGTPPAPVSLVREVAGPQPVIDATGLPWRPAQHFDGGQVQQVGAVAGTASGGVYASALEGVRGYRLAVARGLYDVQLRFADSSCRAAGCRRFGVRVESTTVASSLDLVALVGRAHAFSVVRRLAVTDGRLDITFVPQVGLPTVSAVEVHRVRGGSRLRPVWSQEFTGPAGTGPDPASWLHDVGGQGWGDGELQEYTDSRSNAALDGRGNLAITARRSERSGAEVITSARLQTKHRFSYRYGVLTARFAVPLGRGLWPALWMVGDNSETVGWKAAGEVDIFEGNGALPGWSWSTVHGPDAAGHVYGIGRSHVGPARSAAAFHEYALTWTPDALGVTLDGEPVFGVTRADLTPAQAWVFDHPYRLVLNLAVGGSFVGPPDGTTAFPAVLRVDYIRVHE